MANRPRLKAPGEKNPKGITKIAILTHIFNNTDGVDVDDIRQVLHSRFGIVEKDTIKTHLDYLVKKRYVQRSQKSPQDEPIFKPTNDIKEFKELWLDVTNIWVNAGSQEILSFTSTKKVSEFIENEIVSAFTDVHISKIFEGNELYSNLPHNDLYHENQQFKSVCIWAIKSCPLLITHIFKPNKLVLLCLTMTLQRSLTLPEVKRSLSSVIDLSPQEISENFANIAEYIRTDWYKIRFSTKSISKELICTLTMIICFYIFLERGRNREVSKLYYTDKNYLELWEQYMAMMRELSGSNPEILMDTMKIVFIISLTDELFHENQPVRQIPPNAF